MLNAFWAFLSDINTRLVLSWIGGGLVVIAGGVWAIFKTGMKKKAPSRSVTVTGTSGGVAAGRDIRDSKLDTR